MQQIWSKIVIYLESCFCPAPISTLVFGFVFGLHQLQREISDSLHCVHQQVANWC